MDKVQKYAAKSVAHGNDVVGYAAVGYECGRAWILVPTPGTDDKFSIVEVDKESIRKYE